MHVTIKGVGDLREYFGKEPRVVQLPENARIMDLLNQIEKFWGSHLPAYLWDSERHQFRGPVFLVIDQKAVLDLDAPLHDGMEIRITRAIAGG